MLIYTEIVLPNLRFEGQARHICLFSETEQTNTELKTTHLSVARDKEKFNTNTNEPIENLKLSLHTYCVCLLLNDVYIVRVCISSIAIEYTLECTHNENACTEHLNSVMC